MYRLEICCAKKAWKCCILHTTNTCQKNCDVDGLV